MGREVEGPAVSSPVNTLPENGLFIPSEAEESHFLSRPLKRNRSTHSPLVIPSIRLAGASKGGNELFVHQDSC